MKAIYNTLVFLFLTTISFAQGIAVQGIARDNTDTAIQDTPLKFVFYILNEQQTVLYEESEQIRTDIFGVFSHIVKNGDRISNNTFDSIDFSKKGLRIKVTVTVSGQTVEVYNQEFQYVPYAFHAKKADNATRADNADNGVPTGAIMPFAGTKVPAGWLLCDGSTISSQYRDLRDMFPNNKTPDLGGTFLRGTGKSSQSARHLGPNLNEFQMDTNRKHLHDSGTLGGKTTDDGEHKHSLFVDYDYGYGETDKKSEKTFGKWDKDTKDGSSILDTYQVSGFDISNAIHEGDHTHDVDIDSGNTGKQGDEDEVRVASYGVNYIIKI